MRVVEKHVEHERIRVAMDSHSEISELKLFLSTIFSLHKFTLERNNSEEI